MLRKEDIFLIIYFILVIFFLAAFTIVFFVVYQKRKNKLLQERLEAEQRFRDELNTARLEIQEATLKNVSWELHDNIGQLMAVASMQLKLLQKNNPKILGSRKFTTWFPIRSPKFVRSPDRSIMKSSRKMGL